MFVFFGTNCKGPSILNGVQEFGDDSDTHYYKYKLRIIIIVFKKMNFIL